MIFVSQWWNVVVLRALSELPTGTLAIYGYASKLLIIAAFLPNSITTVIFPRISEAWAEGNTAEMQRMVGKTLSMSLFLSLSATMFLYIINNEMVRLLFMHGRMTQEMVIQVSNAFAILVLLAPAIPITDILYKITFSMKDTFWPALLQLFSAMFIVAAVHWAAKVHGISGVAWAIVIPHWGVILAILYYLFKKYKVIEINSVIKYVFRLVLTLFFAASISFFVLFMINNIVDAGMFLSVAKVALIFIIYVPILYFVSRKLGVIEAQELLNYIKWQTDQFVLSIRHR
jgi:putative peptidoglycan lipid II flippase